MKSSSDQLCGNLRVDAPLSRHSRSAAGGIITATKAEIVLSDSKSPLTLVRDLLQLQYEHLGDRLPLALNETATDELDRALAEIRKVAI